MKTLSEFKQLLRKAEQDFIFTQATALAYTTMASLVPVLAVAFFLFKAFGGYDALRAQLLPLIEQNLAPAFGETLLKYIDGFINKIHAGALGTFGLIGFIFTSISTLATIEKTFNTIWGVSKQRSWPKRVTTYWSLLTIGPLLMGFSLALSSKAYIWLKNDNGFIANVLVYAFTLFPYLASGLLFATLYLFMPNVPVDRRDALKAGALAGLVFEIAKNLYATYVVHAITTSSIYGSLAIIPFFLLWIYLVWLIILYGAEICCYLQFKRLNISLSLSQRDRLSPFIIVDILEELATAQNESKAGRTISQLLSYLKISLRELLTHLDFLETEGWIVSAAANRFKGGRSYFLTVPREKLKLDKVLDSLEKHSYAPKSREGVEAFKELNAVWSTNKSTR